MSKSGKSLLAWKHKIARQTVGFSSPVASTSSQAANQWIVQPWQYSKPARRTFHTLPSRPSAGSSNFDGSYFNGSSASNASSSSPKSNSHQFHTSNAVANTNDIVSSYDASGFDYPPLSATQVNNNHHPTTSNNSGNAFLPFYNSSTQQQQSPSSSHIPRSGNNAVPKETRSPTFSLSNGACGIPKSSHSLKPSANPEHVAAANISMKNRIWATPNQHKLTLSTSSGQADTGKSVSVGQDAYFLRPDSLGVADGVGGWAGHKNADPALFSRLLMQYCAEELERYEDVDDPLFLDFFNVDPLDVLQAATDKCLAESSARGLIGSSTALLAVLRRDVLRVANLGDCNCSVIRGTEYLFRSEEQQHSFNYPMQIGPKSKDTPRKDGQRFDVQVQKDDIVILSSDGLGDNLFEEDILEEVLRFAYPSYSPSEPHLPTRRAAFSPQAVSEALCTRAKSVCEDQMATSSPFQQRAMEEGIYYTGGKRDDISVLVAVIADQEDSADRR